MPEIASLAPTIAVSGEAGFILMVHGSGFIPESVILLDGIDQFTKYVSGTQLTATVVAPAIGSAKTARVQVFNPSPGGGTSSTAIVTLIPPNNDWTFLGPSINQTDYPNVYDVLVDRENPQILYVTTHGLGLVMSRDGGITWTLAAPQTFTGAGAVALDPITVDRVLFGELNELHVSSDRGLTWNYLVSFEQYTQFTAITTLVISEFDRHRIYVCLRRNLGVFYRSLNDGALWEAYSFGQTIGVGNFIPWAMAEDPLDGTLYVGVELGDHPQPYRPPFFRSTDGGVTWENLVENMTSADEGPLWHVISIIVHPKNHKVYALTEGAGLYVSLDHGSTWTRRLGAPNCALVMDPIVENRFFGGSIHGGAMISTNDGQSFSPFGLTGKTVGGLALSADGKFLFAACYGSGVYIRPLSEITPPTPE